MSADASYWKVWARSLASLQTRAGQEKSKKSIPGCDKEKKLAALRYVGAWAPYYLTRRDFSAGHRLFRKILEIVAAYSLAAALLQ